MRSFCIPQRAIRIKVGIKVASKAIKNINKLDVEKVIIKATKIHSFSKINLWVFVSLFLESLFILARRETGINQQLKIMRGVLNLSITNEDERNLQFKFLFPL
tara:strand:+ start:3332 stop:3640 length:309 start_codon:yes stop_codon:yes gene_type:complete